jgi:hypothetical protein
MGRWEPTYEESLKAWAARRDQLGGKVHCGGEDCEKCVDNDEEQCGCWCHRCGPLNAWLDAKPEKPEEASAPSGPESGSDVWIMFAVSGIRVWRSPEEAAKDLQGAAFASVERYVPYATFEKVKNEIIEVSSETARTWRNKYEEAHAEYERAHTESQKLQEEIRILTSGPYGVWMSSIDGKDGGWLRYVGDRNPDHKDGELLSFKTEKEAEERAALRRRNTSGLRFEARPLPKDLSKEST